jgi:hypothetical protein
MEAIVMLTPVVSAQALRGKGRVLDLYPRA